jgi:hypothetical protein
MNVSLLESYIVIESGPSIEHMDCSPNYNFRLSSNFVVDQPGEPCLVNAMFEHEDLPRHNTRTLDHQPKLKENRKIEI